MERAHSAPPEGFGTDDGGNNINPFYSRKLKDELRLVRARPETLPEAVSPVEPVPRSEGMIGKGRGSSSMLAVKGGTGTFVTPPSRRVVHGEPMHLELGKQHERCGVQTEGPMPTLKLGRREDPEQGHVHGVGGKVDRQEHQSTEELQRSLEREIVDHLRDQNAKLMLEIEELKKWKQGASQSSGSSWSEVGADGMHVGKGSTKMDDGRMGYHTPRSSNCKTGTGKQVTRYTPNGTRVPEGTPPDSAEPCPPPQHEPPVVPPFPSSFLQPQSSSTHVDDMKKFLDGYERIDVKPTVLKRDVSWEPQKELNPNEARAFWLEKEVQALRTTLASVSHGNAFQKSEYWGGGFQRCDFGDHLNSKHGPGQLTPPANLSRPDPDVAEAISRANPGDPPLQAWASMGGVLQHTEFPGQLRGGSGADLDGVRASTMSSGNQKECLGHLRGGSGDLCPQGRAWQCGGSGDLPLHGRALQHGGSGADRLQARAPQSIDDVYHGDRAFGASQPHAGLDGRSCGDLRYGGEGGLGGGLDPIPTSWETGGGIGSTKADLPDLPGLASPLQFGDWIHLCGPVMRDLSSVASRWWDLTVRQAQVHYADWKQATPLQRVQIEPRVPDELNDRCYGRTEQRGVHLLLKAVSQEVQQMLVTDRQMTSTAILYRLYVRYQPGGPGEKSLILKELTQLPKTSTMAELSSALRSWRRHFGRAREVGASLPDGTLLLRALETAVQVVAKENSQAAFRLAQSRSALKVDEIPEPGAIWDFSQCLLAEAETLVLMSSSASSPADTVPLKLKVMEAGDNVAGKTLTSEVGSTGKGRGNIAEVPCRWFKSDNGCRAGKQCKWLHTWEGITDKNARCWNCGSKMHRKQECPVKGGGAKSKDEPKGSGGGGASNVNNKTSGATTSSTTSTPFSTPSTMTPSKPKINELSATSLTSPGELKTGNLVNESTESVTDVGDGGGDVGKDRTNERTSELLHEATQLLKTLRVPAVATNPKLKVMQIGSLNQAENELVLIDSGATHALRPAADLEEWQKSQSVTVQLAEGTTDTLRLKPRTKILLGPPTSTAWIIPMGGLAELDFSLMWSDNRCILKDDEGRQIEVTVVNGCPMVTQEEGRRILQWLEFFQVHQKRKMAMVQKMITAPEEVDKSQLDLELAMTLKLRMMFPNLPEEIMMKVVPRLEAMKYEGFGSMLPWNRRKRRRLARAKNIVMHVFSGDNPQFWERRLSTATTEVLCIDIQGGCSANLMDKHVYSFALAVAASGRLRVLLGGPPCRTVSALRSQNDGGPGELRSEQYPYGLPDLSPQDTEKVHSDTILFFRYLSLYMIAEEVRAPQDPKTEFILEQPRDPAEYRNDQHQRRYMSVFRTEEWRKFQEVFQFYKIDFDQGRMGHERCKPTTLFASMASLLQLHGLHGQPSSPPENLKDKPLHDRIEASRRWASWAPGLKLAIATAIQEHIKEVEYERAAKGLSLLTAAPRAKHVSVQPLNEGPDNLNEQISVQHLGPHTLQQQNEMADEPMEIFPSSTQHRLPKQPGVQALGPVALEQWKRHFLHDHLPARRDCSHCVRAQGRSKPHRRVQHPEAYTLSIDLSGKMTPGGDQGAQGVKYLMIGCYTIPVTRDGASLLPVPGREGAEEDQPLPNLEEDVEGMEVTAEGADQQLPHSDQLLPEEDEPLEEDNNKNVRHAQAMNETWHRLVDEAHNVAVKQITFVEPVKSRAVKHVLPALARIYCRLRSLGLPLYRIHSDRAKEFCSEQVKTWARERDVITTMTSGSSFKANGRVEGEMNVIKKSIRTLISAGMSTLPQWPLAARHIGERRLRAQLQLLGWPVGPLLRFGATAYALRKSWQARYAPWREVREEIKILGPDMNSSLTNTGYFVESKATGRRFFMDDIVIPEVQQPAVEEQVLYLPERPEAVPLRRQRSKARTPAISMLDIEGERVITQRFPEMFEPRPSWVDSSDSWSLETDEQSASSTSPRMPVDLEEDWWPGGGEMEGVPNTWCGGSSPGTPQQRSSSSRAPVLRRLHCNVTDYIREELNMVDATSLDQTLWMPTLNQAMLNRVALEDQLCALEEETAVENKVAEEFLVTKTISNKEVWDALPDWEPSIKAEYDQLVNQKKAVIQMTQQQLRDKAEAAGVEIELLPGKMVHTRKAQTGAYRSRAVICGNYASATEQDAYAGGTDSTQVRAALKTAALLDWKIMGTDIRTAFLNAKRRDETKLVAMTIPAVFRALGLAREDEVWVVEMALYGLTTSPRDWGVHRDNTLPQLRWHRADKDGRELTGHFEKTADDNLWRLLEVDSQQQVRWCGLLCVYVDDLLFCGEEDVLQ